MGDEDPYENWRSRFDNDGRRTMMEISAEEKRKGEKKGMFMTLFKYILGVNIEATEIEMTTPVTTKRTKMALNRKNIKCAFGLDPNGKKKNCQNQSKMIF